jgi:hypothetical protein
VRRVTELVHYDVPPGPWREVEQSS